MAKKKKTFAELKKVAVTRKEESLCRKCGVCCHIKVGLSDGTYVVHPTATCRYLTLDNLCSIYGNRFKGDAVVCFSREEMIAKDYRLPEDCPYTKKRPGYKPARVVTQEEFDQIVEKELEAGNYNVLLVNRVF